MSDVMNAVPADNQTELALIVGLLDRDSVRERIPVVLSILTEALEDAMRYTNDIDAFCDSIAAYYPKLIPLTLIILEGKHPQHKERLEKLMVLI